MALLLLLYSTSTLYKIQFISLLLSSRIGLSIINYQSPKIVFFQYYCRFVQLFLSFKYNPIKMIVLYKDKRSFPGVHFYTFINVVKEKNKVIQFVGYKSLRYSSSSQCYHLLKEPTSHILLRECRRFLYSSYLWPSGLYPSVAYTMYKWISNFILQLTQSFLRQRIYKIEIIQSHAGIRRHSCYKMYGISIWYSLQLYAMFNLHTVQLYIYTTRSTARRIVFNSITNLLRVCCVGDIDFNSNSLIFGYTLIFVKCRYAKMRLLRIDVL